MRSGFVGTAKRLSSSPIAKDWAWLDAIAGQMSADFMKDGREQPVMQERPDLDTAFE